MIQKGLFKGTCTFPGLTEYIAGSTVMLNIMNITDAEGIEAELTEASFPDGLSGLSKQTGLHVHKLVGSLSDSHAQLELVSDPKGSRCCEIRILLDLSPDKSVMTGEYYKDGIGPAELKLQRA